MSGRKTRKYKETLLQVKQRLLREQENKTKKRVSELLDRRGKDSDSDSEEEQGSVFEENLDSLSLIRRDLYLGLLCLLLLIVLQTYWFSSTCLRAWVLQLKRQGGEFLLASCMYEFVYSETDRISKFKLALFNLDCIQIANRTCDIPASGFVKSSTGDIPAWGSLGYLQAWELRRVNPALSNLVKSRAKSEEDTLRRRVRLENLYTLHYNTELASCLKEVAYTESKWNWNFVVKDYLQAKQLYRDSVGQGAFGYLKPCACYPENQDVIEILLRSAVEI
jgi:hypothetical protein